MYKYEHNATPILAAACLLLAGCYGGETSKNSGSAERMANASIVIVTAVAVQQVFGEATITAEVKRRMNFDSKIEGAVTPEELNVRMKMPLQDNVLKAHKTDGLWVGDQEKMMANWTVRQTGPTTFRIERLGFDIGITVEMDDGVIQGRVSRKLAFDYTYEGIVRQDGSYWLEFRRPLAWDWIVEGQVQRTEPRNLQSRVVPALPARNDSN